MRYYNPKKIIFQHLSVKEKILNDRKKNEEINRFRNGDIVQHLTSVDIQEVVRFGGCIVKKLEGIYRRNKFKEENKTLLQTITKKAYNSVYGGCIRRNIEESSKCVTQSWMRNEYDDSDIE